MRHRIIRGTSIAAAAWLISSGVLAQGRQDGRGGPPFASPLATTLDTNHDGIISAAELDAAASRLLTLDRNGDGRVDAVELAPAPFGRGEGREGRGGSEPGETP